ncbi:unnamed protein product, partial [Prorocentrum cordatum]
VAQCAPKSKARQGFERALEAYKLELEKEHVGRGPRPTKLEQGYPRDAYEGKKDTKVKKDKKSKKAIGIISAAELSKLLVGGFGAGAAGAVTACGEPQFFDLAGDGDDEDESRVTDGWASWHGLGVEVTQQEFEESEKIVEVTQAAVGGEGLEADEKFKQQEVKKEQQGKLGADSAATVAPDLAEFPKEEKGIEMVQQPEPGVTATAGFLPDSLSNRELRQLAVKRFGQAWVDENLFPE